MLQDRLSHRAAQLIQTEAACRSIGYGVTIFTIANAFGQRNQALMDSKYTEVTCV